MSTVLPYIAHMVRKAKSRQLTVLSLFDGLGGARVALDRLGIPCRYFASEVDRYAIKVSSSRYPDIIHIGDVRKVRKKDLPPVDLLIGGSPCTDISILNSNAPDLEGEQSRLFFEWIRIRDELGPSFYLLENVQTPVAVEMNRHVGTNPVAINSDLFVPQNRPRLYWTDIPVPPLPGRPRWQLRYVQFRRGYWQSNRSGVSPAVTTYVGGYQAAYKYVGDDSGWPILKDKVQKKPGGKGVVIPDYLAESTPEECELLQGLPAGYTKVEGVPKVERKRMIGNGYTIPVIAHILSPLSEYLQ